MDMDLEEEIESRKKLDEQKNSCRRSCEKLKNSRVLCRRLRKASRVTCSSNCKRWSKGGMTSCQSTRSAEKITKVDKRNMLKKCWRKDLVSTRSGDGKRF